MGSIGPSPRAVGATVLYLRTPRDSVPGRLGNLRNFEHEHLSTHIRDAREIESSLDVQGFKLVNEPSQLPESQHTDPDRVKAVIYPETEEIIRRATGASKVHAFSHLVRTHCWQDVQPLVDDPSLPDDHQINVVTPSRAAHVDHSREGSFEILRDNLPAEEVERVLKSGRRWAIINLWRPIKPVQRDPLCLCDFRSFEAEDLKTQVRTYIGLLLNRFLTNLRLSLYQRPKGASLVISAKGKAFTSIAPP